jgi:tRNA-specific 2-thiouridylase
MRAGHEVFGITMQVCPDLSGLKRPPSANARPGLAAHGCAFCEAPCACVDATAVAKKLGIRLELVDFRQAFEAGVITPFVEGFFTGRTPNPCAFCNREMKFGLMRQRALELGAEAYATGHYMRLEPGQPQPLLRRAADPARDQSYFLALVPGERFSQVLFPLGESLKTENQAQVDAAQVHVEPPVTSNEICFLRDIDYVDFLHLRRPEGFAPGEIVDRTGKVLGRHAGLPAYTVGQRRGLRLAAPEALYVLRLEAETNRVVVGADDELWVREVRVRDLNWLAAPLAPQDPVWVQIRYRQKPVPARVQALTAAGLVVAFDAPVRAVTPGQVAAFYDHDRLLGGGIIEE